MACNCCAIRYFFLLLLCFLTVFERRSYFFHSDDAIVLAATRTPTRHLILRYRHLTHDYHPISNFGTANEQPVILDASTNRRSGGFRTTPSALPIILIQSRRFSLLQVHLSIEVHRNSTKASKFITIMLRTIRHSIVFSASIAPDDHPRHGAVAFFQWPRRWFVTFPDVCLDAIATIIRVSGL